MTYDPNRPVRQQLTELFREALAQPATWTTRARAWLGRVRSRAATMGGYWGGVILHGMKRAAAFMRAAPRRAADFLRR